MSRRGDSVYRRKDGSWEARYVKGYDALEKKKYGSAYGRTYREAKEKRQAAMDNLLLFQASTGPRNITVGRLVTEWLYINRQRLKMSTIQRYEGLWKNHIESTIGARTALSCTTISLHEYAMGLREKGLAAGSANAVLTFLHSCFKYGHRQYRLPMPDFIYFPQEKKEMRVLSVEEQQQLVAYLLKDMDIYKFGVLLALYTGLRIGELCALQWGDIKDGILTVRKTMQRLKSQDESKTELSIGTPKTSTSLRAIPLPSFLLPYLHLFDRDRQPHEYVLGTEDFPIVEPRVMQYKLDGYTKDLHIENVTPHTLRHSFATRCIECGMDVKTLSCILGHASVATTMNRYVHISAGYMKASLEKLQLFMEQQ